MSIDEARSVNSQGADYDRFGDFVGLQPITQHGKCLRYGGSKKAVEWLVLEPAE
jgi:hypothetical protein